MMDFLVSVLPFVIAIAAAHAGHQLTGYLQDKWRKRKL